MVGDSETTQVRPANLGFASQRTVDSRSSARFGKDCTDSKAVLGFVFPNLHFRSLDLQSSLLLIKPNFQADPNPTA